METLSSLSVELDSQQLKTVAFSDNISTADQVSNFVNNTVSAITEKMDMQIVTPNGKHIHIGSGATITDPNRKKSSISIGYNANVGSTAEGAIAIGGPLEDALKDTNYTKATGPQSIAIGNGAQVSGRGSMQIGPASSSLETNYTLRYNNTVIVYDGKIPTSSLDKPYPTVGTLSSSMAQALSGYFVELMDTYTDSILNGEF